MEADDDEYVRPQVSIAYLQDLLISEYKLKIINYAELNGHEDRNYHIFCEETESTEHKSVFSQDQCESVCTRNSCSAIQTGVCSKYEYVVKVMDLVHSENFSSRSERIQMQMKVQDHLLDCGFICPKVVPSSSGSVVQRFVTSEENVHYLTYMTKYIHGSTLFDIAPLSTETLYEVGSLLAQLHCSLKDAVIPSLELKSASVWALENAFKIKDFVSKAELDAGEQSLVSAVLDHFAQNVLAQMTELPHGVIHGDFHDENILILGRRENNRITENLVSNSDQVVHIRSKYTVIDFADISYSPLVFDLAISASYFMMSHAQPDFIEIIGHFLCGYFMLRRPTPKEVRSLFASICAAFCREVVLAKHSYLEQSRSNSYLITAVDAGLRQLKEIWRIGQGDVMTVWSGIWERYGLTLENWCEEIVI